MYFEVQGAGLYERMKYPGDELIDVIGFDTYQFDRDAYLAGMDRALPIIDSVGKAHNKVIAVTETGYEGIPDRCV